MKFDKQVFIVTGAGAGLGRSHAVGLAERGAYVVVNDLGVTPDGALDASQAARGVVEEITAAGGVAVAHGADVTDAAAVADMVDMAKQTWGRVDGLVCNAGILRDRSFGKMSHEDFAKVISVHLTGAMICCQAVWSDMRAQGYGRIVLTSSASGLYGNFGQSNYGAAKAGLMGLMNVLAIEGARDDIRVNLLAPTAATRMTEGLLPDAAAALLKPETITPGLLYLLSQNAPTKTILAAGAGHFAVTQVSETQGVTLADPTPESVAAAFDQIADPTDAQVIPDAFSQTRRFTQAAAAAQDLDLKWTS